MFFVCTLVVVRVAIYIYYCEDYISLEEYSPESPFGDHTRYYNNVEELPVFRVYNCDKDEEESKIFKNLYRETP